MMKIEFTPEALTSLRSKGGWTQEALAIAAGLSMRSVQNYEAGLRPSLAALSKLGRALGVTFTISAEH